jgi:WD40 repeat protein
MEGAGTSRLWDATTGKEVAVLGKWDATTGKAIAGSGKWQEFNSPVTFSPDGKRVVVGSRDYVHLCDAVTGRRLAILGPHAKMVQLLA